MKGMEILSRGEILGCTKIDCSKVKLDVVIQKCSGKKMFLISCSSTAVKSSGGKIKSAFII